MNLSKIIGLAFILPGICAMAIAAPVKGIVVNEQLVPVLGAKVDVIPDQERYYFPEELAPLASTRSAADGGFSVDAPSSGSLALYVSADNMRAAIFPLPAQPDPTRTMGVKLSPGASITGRVSDNDGKAVLVQIADVGLADSPANFSRARAVPQWLSSASDGTFKIDGLTPHHVYRFLVKAPGLQTADVECTAGVANLRIQLSPGGSSLAALVSASGSLAASFAATPVRIVGESFSEIARADKTSQAAFTGLPPGNYTLDAIVPAPRFCKPASVSLPQDSGTTVELSISSGYKISGEVRDADVDAPAEGVALQFGDDITTSDANGRFQTGKLWLVGPQQAKVLRESGFVSAEEGTDNSVFLPDADGFHDITSVTIRVRVARSLNYTVAATQPTTCPLTLHIAAAGQRDRHIPLTSMSLELDVYRPGEYVTWADDRVGVASDLHEIEVENQFRIPVPLQIGPSARLRGNIIHPALTATTTGPLNRLQVFSASPATSDVVLAEIETTGPFTFPTLPPAAYILEATSGARSQRVKVHAVAGDNAPVTITFESGRRFAGTVTSEDGIPVVAATLTCALPGQSKPVLIETDSEGKFDELEFPSDRITQLTIAQVGYVPRKLTQVALPNDRLSIVLQRAAGLTVRINDSKKSRWRVQLMETATPQNKLTAAQDVALESLATGDELQLQVPRSGRYFVIASEYDGKRFAVSEAFTWDTNLPQPRAINLLPGQQGSILGSIESAPADVAVTAINTTLPDTFETHFEAKPSGGKFSFPSVPPGDYVITAIGSGYAAEVRITVAGGEKASVTLKPEQ